MTKSSIQSLERENDDFVCKLETLAKDFKELKELIEKKELTARTRQDGRPLSPNHELEDSQQFRSDEYDDFKALRPNKEMGLKTARVPP